MCCVLIASFASGAQFVQVTVLAQQTGQQRSTV
jgi:hypothetical protein